MHSNFVQKINVQITCTKNHPCEQINFQHITELIASPGHSLCTNHTPHPPPPKKKTTPCKQINFQHTTELIASPGHSLLSVNTQLEEPHEDGGDVEVRFPHRETSTQQVHGCTTYRSVCWQLAAGRRQE